MIEQIEKLISQGPDIYIFDMDGTLYELDGDNGSMFGSSLMFQVINNSIDFVCKKEECGKHMARKIIEKAMKDKVGISRVLSQRYDTTRSEIFENTWNIDPKNIIKNSEDPINAVISLKRSGKRLFLLTSAPKIWMENVLNELNINNVFERKISGESFTFKSEVFKSLAEEFPPNKMISIGDQVSTDIDPANKYGIETFLVRKPNDLLKLI